MAYQELKFYKVTLLPTVLDSSSVYFVKNDVNGELTIYMTDITGLISYKTNDKSELLAAVNTLISSHPTLMFRNPNPVFTYGTGQNSKNVMRVDYSNGVYKIFEYNPNNSVKKVTNYGLYFTLVKTYNYNVNGTINSVVETVI